MPVFAVALASILTAVVWRNSWVSRAEEHAAVKGVDRERDLICRRRAGDGEPVRAEPGRKRVRLRFKSPAGVRGGPRTADGVMISVPATVPDPISSTIVVKIKGAPDVAAAVITPEADGSVQLLARDADLRGSLQYESGHGKDNIGYWFEAKDTADWTFKIDRPGKFQISAEIAAPESAKFAVLLGEQLITASSPATKDFTSFQHISVGDEIALAAGRMTLTVQPVATSWQPMNLRSITLKPVK